VPGEQRNYGDLNVRNIREGLNRKGLKSGDASSNKKQNHQQQKKRLMQGERYDASDHANSKWAARRDRNVRVASAPCVAAATFNLLRR